MSPPGLIVQESGFGPAETAERLAAAIVDRGMAVLARIDHAAAAAQIGLELRPTEVLIFGHAKSGTPLMQAFQTVAIDLPLKALVWQDGDDRTWLGYNDPAWVATRHGLDIASNGIVAGMTEALSALAKRATSKDVDPTVTSRRDVQSIASSP